MEKDVFNIRWIWFLVLLPLWAGSSFAAHTITTWPDNKVGAVSLTFDDNLPSQISLGMPALSARGLKATFFVITDKVAGDWDPWRTASAVGHEVGSHTKSHPYLTTLTLPQVQDELGGSKSIIDSQVTSQKVLTLAYPYGDYNFDVETSAQGFYEAARSVSCGLNQEPIDFYAVKACSPDSLDDVYAQTDAAQEQGRWLVVFFHSLDGTGYGEWLIGDLENYLDYLMTKNLWAGPFGSIVKYIKERRSATLSVSSSTADQIILNLTDTLDDTVYNEPLTIRSDVPGDWANAVVVQGSSSSTVASVLEGGSRVIYYRAIPDRGPVSVVKSGSLGGFLQDGTGLVSMESEHYGSNVAVGKYSWTPVTNSGYSGTGALQVLPNDEPNPLPAGSGPRLDYQVQFTRTGTHYVWIRALGYSYASDSLHLGLDGGTAGALYITGFAVDGRTWTWSRQTGSGAVATVNVPSAGVHTVNVWMRESGIVLDKLVLTSSSSYTPTGTGPAETVSPEYVAIGDSITAGSHDDISSDGVGFEPILGTLLTSAKGYPITVANEGISGTTAADGAISIAAVLAKYPAAKYYLVMYGSNDASIPAVPSGRGLAPGDSGYGGSYKDSMQRIISAILAAGKTAYLAEVPYTSDPLRSSAAIFDYNAVVDELIVSNGISVQPPPFYAFFQAHPEQLADGLHPNGIGYQSMAWMWQDVLP